MSSVAVFVFLLDNLAGFNNALNDTLTQSAQYSHSNSTPHIHNCDRFTTDQILSAVSQDLGLVIVPSFKNDGIQLNSDEYKERSPEILNTLLDNSLHEAENDRESAYDKKNDDDFNTFYVIHQKIDSEKYDDVNSREHDSTKNVVQDAKIETKVEFPERAPFLVAIFETLANITAQTCAGTLLSPRWVLTAANCVNILSNLYTANNTNITDTSHYTVVVGSSNPLVDGSAHNVTTVLLHPNSNSSQTDNKSVDMDGPYLALMRIEPEVESSTNMKLMAEEVKSQEVMVYGWVLSKNESEYESLKAMRKSALILGSEQCQAMYSFKENDVMCLVDNDLDKNITQLSSGGPVLMVHGGQVQLLSVVQTDEHVFVSYPLESHLDWINHVITNK